MGIQVFGRMSGVPAIVMVIKFECLLYGYSSLFNWSPPSSFLTGHRKCHNPAVSIICTQSLSRVTW